MTTSGTQGFNPSIADLIIEAYSRIQIRPHMLTAQHIVDARMGANLVLKAWGSRGLSLWLVQQHAPIVLQAGVPAYNLDPGTISVLDAYISVTTNGVTVDRIIRPIGRTDYANIPNKLEEGRPSCFWFYRGVQPSVTLWETPDDIEVRTLNIYVMRRIQDAFPVMGQTIDVEDRYLPAFAAALAANLSEKWAPMQWTTKMAAAKAAWDEVAADDGEKVDVFIRPQLDGYYQ